MKTNIASLVLALCLACGAVRAEAGSPERKCPVVIDSVELSYNHQGETSKHQLRVEFDNHSGKHISKIAFSLSLLDVGGYPHPYPDDLMYGNGLEIGKTKAFTWELASESVDIHRTGETVVVSKVEFSDTVSWIDDGSETCAFKVDFHAR